MEKLRDETLDEILKKEKAYAHELRLIIPELKLLRDIYNGKRPLSDYERDMFTVQIPVVTIEGDNFIQGGDVLYMDVGQTYLVRYNARAEYRYIVYRVK